jgi:hypothetical protein
MTLWLFDLLRRRSVRIALGAWLLVNGALIALAGDHLPFHASSLAEPPATAEILQTDAMFVEVFALMGVVQLLTRRRRVPDLAARTDQEVAPAEAIGWATYNLLAYVAVPFLVFRRRYTNEQLNLRSSDRRRDITVIAVVLLIESTVQLLLNDAVLRLGVRQLLFGAPLTFLLSFAGTVLPTMIFVYSILTPRYLKLTRSVPTTVILGGLTYAMLHLFDGWTSFVSPADATLSFLYLLLFYTGPGMFKTFITIRTANAWTHVWAYHAIAPHTLIDTPMFVKIFGIR